MTTEVGERVAAPALKEKLSVVGQSVVRPDSLPKVCGLPLFAADLKFDNMLFGACLLPPIACGRIARIDASRARALPGVHAVLLGEDLPAATCFGTGVADQPVICSDRIYTSGDVVALVAAEDPATAARALDLIDVEYEELLGIYDPVRALDEGAPIAYPGHPRALKGNLLTHLKIRKGDPIDAALARADVVVEGVYSTQFVDHAYLESDIGIAVPGPTGGITLYGPLQAPHTLRRVVGPVLGLPLSRIRVIATPVGGGFGGKEESSLEVFARAGVLALKTGRPVVLEYSRHESMTSRAKRCPAVIRSRLGATRDGQLVATSIEIFIDKGPYAALGGLQPPPINGIIFKMSVHATGPYEIPNVHIDAYNVLTNNSPTSSMRGLGVPQVHFACESLMDELAAALGISPVALRLQNGFAAGSKTATGQVLRESVGLRECIRRAAEAADWDRPKASPAGPKRKGRGIAAGWYCTGAGQPSDAASASVFMAEDGTVQVGVAVVELGQGSHTALAQVVAEELGVRFEDVTVLPPDSGLMADAGFTAGSRSTFVPGNALIRAARQLKATLAETAAGLLGVSPEQIAIADRVVSVVGQPDRSLPLREVALTASRQGRPLWGQGWWAMPPKTFDLETGQGEPFQVYSFGAQIAEVEVDTETGEVAVERVVAAHDVGRAINPTGVVAQIEGGVVMGQGMALSEESIVRNGMVLNPSLTNYLMPTSLDAARQIVSIVVEDTTSLGPFGAKGIGESATVPTAVAIANAVADALGARVRQLPMTQERIMQAIDAVGNIP